MITDDQTNKVYFSEYLRAYKCWKSIKEALLEHEINFEMLPGTKGPMGVKFVVISCNSLTLAISKI